MKLFHSSLLKYTTIFFLTLLCGIYFRLYPLRTHTPGDSHEKATVLVIAQLKEKARQQVELTHPNFSPAEKEIAIRNVVNTLIHNGKEDIRQAIETVSSNIFNKTRQGKEFPYLLASDSYYYFDLTQRLIETGHISKIKRGSKYLNDRMLAPIGHYEPINWHPYVGFGLYKILDFFQPGIPAMYAVSFTPLIIYALSLFALIWVCSILNFSGLATLITTASFSLAPSLVKRSMFGWYDNDPYNILFPILIIGLLLKLSKGLNQKKWILIYSLLSAAVITVHAHFWQGWMFFFTMIVAALAIPLLLSLFRKHARKNEAKNLLQFTFSLLLLTLILISVSFGFKEFFILYEEGFKAITDFLNPKLAPWPDLYLSVGELKKSSLSHITKMTIGPVLFSISCLGIIILILKSFRKKELSQNLQSSLIGIYFLATLFITLGAQRFVFLCVVPMVLTLGLATDSFFRYLKTSQFKPLNVEPLRLSISVLISMILLSLPFTKIIKSEATLINPIYNETWDRALTQLKEKTPKDSIITTWWSPGHFIKSTAQRRVTFDGASINYPQGYWVSNVLLTDNEIQSLGMLRMLNNSGHLAAKKLQEFGFTLPQSVKFLHQIVKLNPIKAHIVLNNYLKNSSATKEILSLTHQTPPPSYILLYNEFVDNNIQLKFIGNWDFDRIEEINQSPQLLKELPKANTPDYIDFLWELSGGPNKYSGILDKVREKDGLLIFEHNLIIDKETYACQIDSQKYGKGTPLSIFYIENDKVKEKMQEGADKSYSVVLYHNGQSHKAVLMDRSLAQSMLVQMYFLEAKGLRFIKPLLEEHDLTRRTTIKIFEVNWKKFENYLRNH